MDTSHQAPSRLDLQLPHCAISVITTKVVSSNPAHGEDVVDTTLCDKFVSDLRQVFSFSQVFRFPPAIKLTAMK